MFDIVELTDVEMLPNSKVFENVFVVMKCEPCNIKLGERFIRVSLEVGIVNKIQDSPNSTQDSGIGCSSEKAEKHLLHVLVLGTCPLSRQRNALLEMAKARVGGHGLEAMVDLLFTTIQGSRGPTDDVVLENPLVKLMEKIWSYS
jgi:hypothetical protein